MRNKWVEIKGTSWKNKQRNKGGKETRIESKRRWGREGGESEREDREEGEGGRKEKYE